MGYAYGQACDPVFSGATGVLAGPVHMHMLCFGSPTQSSTLPTTRVALGACV